MRSLKEQIQSAKEKLLNGGVVAFPTETVFGLGVIYNDYQAYQKLNKVKNREDNKPYTMMVSSKEMIQEFALINEKINRVIDAFIPGPLTVLLKVRDYVPGYVTHNTGVIGIRIPTNKEALMLLDAINIPLLVPSANKSGEKPARNDEEVRRIFHDELDYIISGESKIDIPSTIVSFVQEEPILIRKGPIDFLEILKVYHG